MKLKEITFREAPRIPGIRPGALSSLDCANPNTALLNWRALIRGPVVYFVSPPGFRPGINASDFDKSGPCLIFEVPRTQCYLQWAGTPEEIAGVQKFDTPPFGPEPEANLEEASEPKTGGLLAQVGV